jgi:hypothetical protein
MSKKAFRPDVDAPTWRGGHSPYDIIKEGSIALLVVVVLTLLFTVVFGSPDEHAITIKTWSNAAPTDFATTALNELNGTSRTAQYGAPYNKGSTGQQLGPLKLAKWVGVRIGVNTVNDFVIDPLKSQPSQPILKADLAQWKSATGSTRSGWVTNYTTAAAQMKFVNGQLVVNATNAGPLPVMMQDLTQMARSGALDQALITQAGFYTTNYTLPLLFLADSGYMANLATTQHLTGSQWGMMNETGNYPGQAWLWLYTFWYQIPPFNTSPNGDVLVWGVMMLASLGLLLAPFIPGIRSFPRKSRIYRLIWREYYQSQEKT